MANCWISYRHHLTHSSLTDITLLTHHLPTSLTDITLLTHHLPTSLTYFGFSALKIHSKSFRKIHSKSFGLTYFGFSTLKIHSLPLISSYTYLIWHKLSEQVVGERAKRNEPDLRRIDLMLASCFGMER